MKNALRLGAAVAAATLVGVSSDSAKGFFIDVNEVPDFDNCSKPTAETLQLRERLNNATRLNHDLETTRDQLNAQVEELMMRLETMETTCEDAASKDGCPTGCEPERECICDGPGADFWGPE